MTGLQSRVDRTKHLHEPVLTVELSTSLRQRRSLSGADNGDLENEVERLQKVVAELRAQIKTTNISHAKTSSDFKKVNDALKTSNAKLQSQVNELEARVNQLIAEGVPWTYETILKFSNVDFKAIFGLEKEQWNTYLDHLDLHGASDLWTHPSVDWRTGYAITQIKLRQNLIYALIKIIFKVPGSTCSTIFKSCVEFSATVAVHVMDIDSREYSCLYRLNGITYDHHGVQWTKIKYFTDANEVPMQNMHNEEAHHRGHSAYYGHATLKHQMVLNECGEPFWASGMYLPHGACDSELLKNGLSLAAGKVPAKNFYDLMQGFLKKYIFLGTCLVSVCVTSMYIFVRIYVIHYAFTCSF